MTTKKLYILAICLLLVNTQIDWGSASFLDYIWPDKKINYYNAEVQSIAAVPFELSEEKEKFILDSAKILGNKLSELDFCQQRVILELKSSCKSLNEEQIGKLAVTLMNCQSYNDGREVFECSDKMSLKDCTSSMSSETRNIYGQIRSQTKAICLTVRHDQFRAVAEMTVNKLMDSASNHLEMMDVLKTSQRQLEQSTLGSIDEISENSLKLLETQQELLRLSEVQKLHIETNLREILKEKSLLKSSQAEISTLIINIKKNIDLGLSDIQHHNSDVKEAYVNLVSSLNNLHESTNKILNSLDEASESISDQNQETASQIEKTILQLKEVDEIVTNLSRVLIDIRRDFDECVALLTKYFGENFVKMLPLILCHVLYLLIGMLCLIFINADYISRLLFLSTLCLNLAAVLYGFINMDLALLTETIIAILFANTLAKLSRKFDWRKLLSVDQVVKVGASLQNGYHSRINSNRRPTSSRDSSILNGYSDPNPRFRRSTLDYRSMTDHQSTQLNEEDHFSDRSRRQA